MFQKEYREEGRRSLASSVYSQLPDTPETQFIRSVSDLQSEVRERVQLKFTFIHLADAFIQSDLQLRNTIKRQINAGSACNTKFQPLFRLVLARQGEIKERESKVFFKMKSDSDERDEFSAVALKIVRDPAFRIGVGR